MLRPGGRLRGAIGALALAVAVPVLPAAAQEPARVSAQISAGVATQPPVAVAAAPRERRRHAHGDPLEGFNRAMFKVFKVLDRIVYRPTAIAYRSVIPKFLRGGIRHVFSNIGEPVVFLNDMLQLKPKRAVKTLGRFVVNSTLGIGGLIDVAKTDDFKLPHHDNGFGNTLGRYGVGPGPYLFLPFVGPSNIRDVLGDGADGIVLPYAIGTPFDDFEYQIARGVLTGLDRRAESDSDLRALEAGAVDPYATLRSAYLQDRAATIAELRGRSATPDALDDPLADPAGSAPASGPAALPADDPLVDPAGEGVVAPAEAAPTNPAVPSEPATTVQPLSKTSAIARRPHPPFTLSLSKGRSSLHSRVEERCFDKLSTNGLGVPPLQI